MKKLNRLGLAVRMALCAVALLGMNLAAFASAPTAPDASGIIDTATTAFYAVGALVTAVVGYFVIVRIVHWIRK